MSPTPGVLPRQDLKMCNNPVMQILTFHQQLNYSDIPTLIYFTAATSPFPCLHLCFPEKSCKSFCDLHTSDQTPPFSFQGQAGQGSCQRRRTVSIPPAQFPLHCSPAVTADGHMEPVWINTTGHQDPYHGSVLFIRCQILICEQPRCLEDSSDPFHVASQTEAIVSQDQQFCN